MSRPIIYTAGVFDLFHRGHVEILEESAKLGRLFAGVVTDEGTERYKGKRPVFSQAERLDIVASSRFVDRVFLQDGTDPSPVLRRLAAEGLKPAVMTHGDDWTELLQGNETLRELGIEFHLIPRTRGRFTSHLIQQIRAVV